MSNIFDFAKRHRHYAIVSVFQGPEHPAFEILATIQRIDWRTLRKFCQANAEPKWHVTEFDNIESGDDADGNKTVVLTCQNEAGTAEFTLNRWGTLIDKKFHPSSK